MASLGRLCASPSIASFASSHSKTCIFSSPRLFFKHPIPSSSLISSFVSSPIHAHPSDTLHNTTGVEKEEEEEEEGTEGSASNGQIDTVSAVLFDMDGVLCDSEDRSRKAAVDLFAEMGFQVSPSDFIPFMGTGEANFLGGVARTYGITDFDANSAKAQFFKIYFEKYAQPNSGLAYSGALNLIKQCKMAGLKLAVASSADRVKVDVNLAAAGLPQSCFDAIVSADAFENLKPAPDIFLAAAKILNVPPNQCIVIEDALAGLQAANAAGMRCIAVTTTLGKEKLIQGRPSLIRKDIGDISLNDIVNLQKATDFGEKKAHSSKDEIIFDGKDILDNEGKGFLSGLQMSLDSEILPGWEGITRREVLKFTSLAAGLSCIFITISRWKAMSYTSPKSIMNAFSGLMKSQFTSNSETSRSDHVMQIKHYIADLESRGGGEEVPDFSVGLDWLNTTPLQLHKDLRGKVVIFDFWTYCCINCMHVLPDLDYLEKKYKDKPFTVVGVHSAKFDNEKDLDAIRNAVLRYNVTHPVVNDGEMIMWRRLGVNSWPTFVVVSPQGRVVARLTGEGHRQDLGDIVEAALQYYGERKLLDNNPIPKLLESQKDPRLLLSPLKFPGKLVIDLANQRLFISDSNHHRIVVTDLKGNFIQQVGGRDGDGFHDGPFEDASFTRPQGLCYNYFKNVLYVADTENHALREVDFMSETVRTLAGNGEKGLDYKGGKKGMLQVLNSPWDLCFEPVSGVLYIAMAGQHQIWIHDLADGTTKAFSGDGYERNRNGKRGSDTSYAQPSGLSLSPDTKEIYVADSESSSIRAMNLNSGGSRLLAGGDPVFEDNLFQFGDKDGVGIGAQFQHPLGVFCGPKDLLFIADSYNHKIKVMDLKSKQVKTLAGTGHAGYKDGNGLVAQLSEPAGLTQGPEGSLYIADTNNNVIRILSLKEGGDCVLSTLELKGVKSPLQNTNVKPRRLHRRPSTDTEIVQIEPISSISGDLQLIISLPAGYHFTKGASSKFLVDLEPEEAVTLDPLNGVLDAGGHALLHFKCLEAGSAKAQIYCKVYYCQKDEVCLYKALLFQVPFSPSSGTSTETVIKYDVKPPATINGRAKAIS